MKNPSSPPSTRTRGIPWVLLAMAVSALGVARAQDPVVALGRVGSTGLLDSGASSVGAVIAPVRNAAGDYTITVTAPGAFTGTGLNDFTVQASVAGNLPGDGAIRSTVSAVTGDSVTVEVHVDDVENSPSGSVGLDSTFFFTLLRNSQAGVDPSTTSYLLATGRVDSVGGLISSLGRHGVVASVVPNAVGDFAVTLTKPGGFDTDTANDYVLILTLEGSGAAAYAIRGDVASVASANSVQLIVRTDDVQGLVDAANGVASSRGFVFSVYQVTPMPAGTSNLQSLVANARVDAAGILQSSTAAANGGTISSVRQATGDYRVTITSAGAFRGRTAADFIAHATLDQGSADDDGIMTSVVLADGNTLHVDVAVTDLEASGLPEGEAADVGFYLTVLNASPGLQPDLSIGRTRQLSRMVGNDRYDPAGRGQILRLALDKLKWSTYHFALENDGKVEDDFRLTQQYRGRILHTKYFRFSGGRKNVTGLVIRKGLVETGVAPGETVLYQGWVKYGSPKIRPRQTVRISARSLTDPSKVDAVRVEVKSLPFRPGFPHRPPGRS